jgi:RNA polymerase sigma factor (sigma-70 family)
MSVLTTKPVGWRSNQTGFSLCPSLAPSRDDASWQSLRFPCQDPDHPPHCPFASSPSAFRRSSSERLSAGEEHELFDELRCIRQRLMALPVGTDLLATRPDRGERMRLSCRACSIRHYLGHCYFKLAVSVARAYAKSYQEIDDLVGQACITLMRALDLFDVQRGYRFSTYATRAIRSELRRDVLRRRRHRDLSVDPVRLMNRSVVCAPRSHPGGDAYCALEELLGYLEPREVDVVRSRFGLHDRPGCETLQALADRLGVSRERVRQVEQLALRKLRHLAGESTGSALRDALD